MILAGDVFTGDGGRVFALEAFQAMHYQYFRFVKYQMGKNC